MFSKISKSVSGIILKFQIEKPMDHLKTTKLSESLQDIQEEVEECIENRGDESYTFIRRISESTLINEVASKIVTAEKHFREKNNSALETYLDNLSNVTKMDRIFGTVD